MIHSLDHIVIAVRDLEAATRNYSQMLGCAPSWNGEHAGQGTKNTLFRLENTYLELLSPQGDGPFASYVSKRLDDSGEGLMAIAFGTDDVEKFRTELKADGLDVPEAVDGLAHDGPSMVEILTDPTLV